MTEAMTGGQQDVPGLLARALAHHRQGDWAQAQDLYRQVLALDPDQVDALQLSGVALAQAGDAPGGEALLARAAARRPDADILANLGAVRAALGWLDAAAHAYSTALDLNPSHGEARFNLGNLHSRQGRWDQAADQLARAVVLMPGHVGARINLAIAQRHLGRWAEAEASLRLAVNMTSGHLEDRARACFNLASLCDAQGRLDEAEQVYRQALEHSPHLAVAWLNLGDLLGRRHRPVDAMACVERALASGAQGGLEATIQGAAQALRLHLAAHLCDWDGVDAAAQALRARLDAGDGSGPPFATLCLDLPDAGAVQRQAARLHAATHAVVQPLASARQVQGGTVQGGAVVRVGYLSADFHQHATAHLLAGVLESHDRARVEVWGLSYGPDDGSALRARIRAGVDHFIDLAGLTDAAAAAAISAAGIDVLVDLKGYTQGARPAIAAHRPAPVTAAYLGYPGTLGAPWIDYALVDGVALPPDAAAWWDEAVVDLGGCYQANDGARPIDPVPSRAALGLPEGAVVFACFNAAYKITRPVAQAWRRILARVPGSVLWLLDPGPALPALRAALGSQADRLIVAPALPKERMAAHLARQGAADLFLDTAPVNAHTTAADALYAGLPLLTIAGRTFVARVAASLLQALGLPDLVAGDLAAYEEKAVALALDPAALADVRRRLAAARTRAGGPFDTQALCRRLEWAYEEMRARHRAGQPPTGFRVPVLP